MVACDGITVMFLRVRRLNRGARDAYNDELMIRYMYVVYIRLDYKYIIVCTEYHALDSTSNHSMNRVM